MTELPCLTDVDYLTALPNARQWIKTVGSWEINAVTAGSGPSIVLLHGLGLSWRWWEPVLDVLVKDYTVTAIDLPGAGKSTSLKFEPTQSDYNALVASVLDETGPALVIGHSLGGYVALQGAKQSSHRIKGLFLIAPAGFGSIENKLFKMLALPGVGSALSRLGSIGTPLLLRSLVHQRATVDEMMCWIDISPLARSQFLFQLQLGMDRLGRTTENLILSNLDLGGIPVALMWGRHDSVFSIETARRACEILHCDDLTVAEHSGHFPHLEENEVVIRALNAFILRTGL